MTDASDLPTWRGPRGGSGCDNEDCDVAEQFVRVLSREEIERVYREPEKLPGWPLPEPFTHMCTWCGQAYAGYDPPAELADDGSRERPAVPLARWDWDLEEAYELPVREAVARFVAGAPTDEDGRPSVSTEQLVEGVDRHVPGADPALAREVLAESDLDVAADPAADYL